MSNRTAPRPSAARTRAKATAKAGEYRRTTARLEGLRDGKPLIFGWGGHLTRAQKNAYQHAALYAFMGFIGVLIVGVIIYGVIKQNAIIPNESIASVNGVTITQDTYRKRLAFDTQNLWNEIQGELQQKNTLSNAANPNTNQIAIVTAQIQANEGNYSQATTTVNTMNSLVEDQLIQDGARRFEQQDHVPAATFTPTSAQVDKQLQAFKAAFPAGETYQDFLSKNTMSNADVRSFITMQVRRTLMQSYLASLLTSPITQVRYRRIETDTMAQAQSVYNQIVQHHGNWTTLAKQDSVDVNTKNLGGDMNFVPPGTGDSGIEVWAYAPGRKVNDITVLKDASGTFDVVQITDIQKNRPVDATLLSSAKSNALDHWLSGQKVAPFNHLSTPDSTMMNDARNLPVTPSLSAQLPVVATPGVGSQNIPGVTG